MSIPAVGAPSGGGNDFSADVSCKALWRFEDGALTVDDIGGNTLVNNNGATANTSIFFEGAASTWCGAGQSYYSIADSSLDSGFPFKSTEGHRDFTICFRARTNGFWSVRDLVSKRGSFELNAWSTTIEVDAELAGGGSENATHLITMSANIWYSIAFTYRDADKAWRIRAKNETTGVTTETIGNFADYIEMSTGDLWIGDDLYRTNWIDEVVVFNEVKTAFEIDAIFNQEYPGQRGIGVCVNVLYLTDTTGVLWYVEQTGEQFIDDDVLTANVDIGGANTVTVDGTPEVDDTFYEIAEIEMTSGLNDGFRRMAVSQSGDNTVIVNGLPNYFADGDTYNIYPGCGQSAEVCRDRFNNADNYTGHLYVPKPEEAMT